MSLFTLSLSERRALEKEIQHTKDVNVQFILSTYLGSIRGVNGHTAKLYGVSPSHARQLSRYYWIGQIDLAPDGPSS